MHTKRIKDLYKEIIFSYICKILREHSKKDKFLSENEIESYLHEDLARDEKCIVDLVQKHTNIINSENIIDSIFISDINDYLNKEFGLDLKPSTIARTLNALVQGNSLELNLHRFDKNSTENTDKFIKPNIATCSYYIDSIFALDEIEMLSSMIEGCTYTPSLNKQEFISKINSLISKEKHSKYIVYNSYNNKNYDDGIIKNIPNTFDILRKLNEAINSKRKIIIIYGEYKFDYMKIELKESFSEGLSPYFILFDHGQFYLFAKSSFTNDLASYRIDQIIDVTLLDDDIAECPYNKDYTDTYNKFTFESLTW